MPLLLLKYKQIQFINNNNKWFFFIDIFSCGQNVNISFRSFPLYRSVYNISLQKSQKSTLDAVILLPTL